MHQPGIDQRDAAGLSIIDNVVPLEIVMRKAALVQVGHRLVNSMGDLPREPADLLGAGEEAAAVRQVPSWGNGHDGGINPDLGIRVISGLIADKAFQLAGADSPVRYLARVWALLDGDIIFFRPDDIFFILSRLAAKSPLRIMSCRDSGLFIG